MFLLCLCTSYLNTYEETVGSQDFPIYYQPDYSCSTGLALPNAKIVEVLENGRVFNGNFKKVVYYIGNPNDPNVGYIETKYLNSPPAGDYAVFWTRRNISQKCQVGTTDEECSVNLIKEAYALAGAILPAKPTTWMEYSDIKKVNNATPEGGDIVYYGSQSSPKVGLVIGQNYDGKVVVLVSKSKTFTPVYLSTIEDAFAIGELPF